MVNWIIAGLMVLSILVGGHIIMVGNWGAGSYTVFGVLVIVLAAIISMRLSTPSEGTSHGDKGGRSA